MLLALLKILSFESRIAGRRLEQPKLSTKEFRNVSIITALNAQKTELMNLEVHNLLQRQVRL